MVHLTDVTQHPSLGETRPITRAKIIAAMRRGLRYMRNPAFIYSALALAGTALIILAVAPLASKVVERWSQRDIELRSRLIFNTIRDQVVAGLASTSSANLVAVFERIAEDERVLGLGFCNEAGQLVYATRRIPPGIDCRSAVRAKTDTFATASSEGSCGHGNFFQTSLV
jgi:trehalose 6-phosphate synthase